jgi:Family of unknown function (DUF5681)
MGPTNNLKPFKKGQSGNPGGRPKIPDEVKEAARAHTEEAITVLVEVMKDTKAPPSARVSAAGAILDRGWGRPQQSVDMKTSQLTHEECLEQLK